MSTRTQSFVLLLFAAALLRLGTSDMLLRFVKASARPWVLVSGVVILVLAVWSLVASSREDRASAAGTAEDTEAAEDAEAAGVAGVAGVADTVDEHGHGPASRSAWLVTLPVIAVLVIGPPALGQYTANRRDAVTAVPAGHEFGELPKGTTVVSMRVFDFALRAIGDGRRTLAGRTVALSGFVARPVDGGFVLARLVITCCAADAAPVTVRVRSTAPVPATGGWVRVTGTYAGQDPTDTDVPLLRGAQVQAIAAPAEPYD